MTQVIEFATNRRSLAASAPLTDEEIRYWHLKHISEIISQGTKYGPAINADISRFHLGRKNRLEGLWSV